MAQDKKTMKARLVDRVRWCVGRGVARARSAGAQLWYSLNAPSSIAAVDRTNERDAFLWFRARSKAGLSGPGGHSVNGWRPEYAWGILKAAMIASALGLEAITLLECGVAGGNGLLAMESLADDVEMIFGIECLVVGFDTGTGMPPAVDHRDAPFAVKEGQFGMEPDKLRARLRRATLRLAPVGETMPEFLAEQHPPIGFVAFDVDYYSSTMEALTVLDAPSERLLPRVFLYFQGLMWHPWTDFNGARAAIADFNAGHEQRKLSPIHGLKYSLPRSECRKPWPEMMYVAEMFDHELYAADQHIEPFDTRLRDG